MVSKRLARFSLNRAKHPTWIHLREIEAAARFNFRRAYQKWIGYDLMLSTD
jgi:hypothetical protein